MTAYPYVLTDSSTMLRRNLRRMRRYPSLTLFIAGIPVVLLDRDMRRFPLRSNYDLIALDNQQAGFLAADHHEKPAGFGCGFAARQWHIEQGDTAILKPRVHACDGARRDCGSGRHGHGRRLHQGEERHGRQRDRNQRASVDCPVEVMDGRVPVVSERDITKFQRRRHVVPSTFKSSPSARRPTAPRSARSRSRPAAAPSSRSP